MKIPNDVMALRGNERERESGRERRKERESREKEEREISRCAEWENERVCETWRVKK